jgi:hypothetical protein
LAGAGKVSQEVATGDAGRDSRIGEAGREVRPEGLLVGSGELRIEDDPGGGSIGSLCKMKYNSEPDIKQVQTIKWK